MMMSDPRDVLVLVLLLTVTLAEFTNEISLSALLLLNVMSCCGTDKAVE